MAFEVRNRRGESVSPLAIGAAIQRILRRQADLGYLINITIEPERDALSKIFSLKRITRLSIDLKLPNADDNSEKEQEILKELIDQNIKEQKTVLSGMPNRSIKLDERNQALANVASRNGYVEAQGRDEHNQPQKVSTRDYPDVEVVPIRFTDDVFSKLSELFGRQKL
jgi:hypothetical protein